MKYLSAGMDGAKGLAARYAQPTSDGGRHNQWRTDERKANGQERGRCREICARQWGVRSIIHSRCLCSYTGAQLPNPFNLYNARGTHCNPLDNKSTIHSTSPSCRIPGDQDYRQRMKVLYTWTGNAESFKGLSSLVNPFAYTLLGGRGSSDRDPHLLEWELRRPQFLQRHLLPCFPDN